MQLIVVAATLPSLIVLSRTTMYPVFRIAGALFAGGVSLAWIAERALTLHTPVDLVVGSIAHEATFVAAALFVTSLILWWLQPASQPGLERI